VDLALKRDGDALILVGDTGGHLGCSLYLREIESSEAGPPPPVDFAAERRNGDFVRSEICGGRISACHDVSDGGLLAAIAEMAIAGRRGATLRPMPPGLPPNAYYFGEDQARYVIETPHPEAVLEAALAVGVPARVIGVVGGASLTLPGAGAISVDALKATNEAWLPGYMAQS
jgi:phosphoribosylformylglycinamidine (FGAM) synthase-like enzyme